LKEIGKKYVGTRVKRIQKSEPGFKVIQEGPEFLGPIPREKQIDQEWGTILLATR